MAIDVKCVDSLLHKKMSPFPWNYTLIKIHSKIKDTLEQWQQKLHSKLVSL